MTSAYRALALGLGTLVLAGAVAVLADDVRRWPSALTSGDVQVRVTPLRPDPWRAPDRFPFRPGARILGVGDDLEYRRSVRLFINSRAYVGRSVGPGGRIRPVEAAKRRFRAIERGDDDPAIRSAAANFRGVLTFEGAGYVDTGFVRQTIRLFSDAIRIDASNDQAKFNLELMLDRSRPRRASGGGSGAPRVFQEVEGSASTAPGRGY
jgi:hypothetical protein